MPHLSNHPYHAYSANTRRCLDSLWTLVGAPILDKEGDHFGSSISLSSVGTIVAVGSPNNDHNGRNSGSAGVFSYSFAMNKWLAVGETLYGATSGDHFGSSVSMSGDGKIVAVGAR